MRKEMYKSILKKYKELLSLFSFVLLSFAALAQTIIPLYKGKVPNSIASPNLEISDTIKGHIIIRKVSTPTLTAYFPEKEKVMVLL